MSSWRPPLKESESYSALYTRTQTVIFRFIYGLHGGPQEEVEDLTCETFMRAWKSRHRFRGDEQDALCWLFTIARHLVIDAHRRKKTRPHEDSSSLDEDWLNLLRGPIEDHPEEQAAKREQYARLWHSLQDLREDRRELLVLRYMLGWQVKEIAGYLKMEENTVSVYIRRSLDQIRQGWMEE